MRSLYFFGDSICFGQYVSIDQVWTTGVSRMLSESIDYGDVLTQVTAVNGETSRDALARMKHCVLSHSPNVVWIQFGLNDANYWLSDDGVPRVTMESYIANIKEMVERCVSCGTQKILLATNHVVTKQLEHESPSDRYSENAKSYNQVLRDSFSSSLMEIVTVVDMEILMAAKFRESNDYLLSDGVHLNRIGHSAYLDIVSSPIKEALNSIDVR
jgi:lysophospholipase L1-like esterase